MFFFSSRRRHTRWPRDWSSDVCSSDLVDPPAEHKAYLHRAGRTARAGESGTVVTLVMNEQRDEVAKLIDKAGVDAQTVDISRSEERRVGKEGRSQRWWYE